MGDSRPQIKELSPGEQEPGIRLALREFEDAQYQVQAEAFREAEASSFRSNVRVWGAFREGVLTGSLLRKCNPANAHCFGLRGGLRPNRAGQLAI